MMKNTIFAMLALCAVAQTARAYEYPLQFTPNPGYRNLVVAGYRFEGNVVVGNCSYQTVSGGSGKGNRGSTVKKYEQTCRWDHFGNLLSMTAGAPAVPQPASVNGTKTIYAFGPNGDYTGVDTKPPSHGFVSSAGSHYKWLTPTNLAVAQGHIVYTLTMTLKSDGDFPLHVSAVQASAALGVVQVKSTTCVGEIAVGDTCATTVTYDPTKLTSPIGLAHDVVRVDLTSDAGEPHDFVQNFVVVMSPILP